MNITSADGLAIHQALLGLGYRLAAHPKFFPFESLNPAEPGPVHFKVDEGARAIFCSQELYDELTKVLAS